MSRCVQVPFDAVRSLMAAPEKPTELTYVGSNNITKTDDTSKIQGYELLLIIAVILSYGSVSGFLHAWRLPEGLVRILPLVTFGIGLVAKPRILRWLASRRTAVVDGARQANAGVSQG